MYASNVPISAPNPLSDINPDVDFNGFHWSNTIGIFFHISDLVVSPIKAPPLQEM